MHRRHFLSLLGLAAAWPVAARAGADNFPSLPKSLWVWKTPLAGAPEAAAFAHRYGFGTVFYSVPPDERGDVAKVMAGLSAFREQGIRLYGVAGSPAWAQQPELPRPLMDLIQLGAKGAFDGLCLDVEPQTLPAWRESRNELMAGYVGFMARAAEEIQAAKLSLCAATVPAYSNQAAEGKTVMERVAKLTDATALMAYRSDPDRALKVARRSLDLLDGCKRQWWFGVTTKRGAPSDISYGGMSPAAFKAALTSLDSGLRGRPGYLGIAVNDYLSLRELLEG